MIGGVIAAASDEFTGFLESVSIEIALALLLFGALFFLERRLGEAVAAEVTRSIEASRSHMDSKFGIRERLTDLGSTVASLQAELDRSETNVAVAKRLALHFDSYRREVQGALPPAIGFYDTNRWGARPSSLPDWSTFPFGERQQEAFVVHRNGMSHVVACIEVYVSDNTIAIDAYQGVPEFSGAGEGWNEYRWPTSTWIDSSEIPRSDEASAWVAVSEIVEREAELFAGHLAELLESE